MDKDNIIKAIQDFKDSLRLVPLTQDARNKINDNLITLETDILKAAGKEE